MSCILCHIKCKNSQTTLFSFPRNEQRRKQWLGTIDRNDLMGKNNAYFTQMDCMICDRHFEEKYIINSPKKTKSLSPNAMPTLNLKESTSRFGSNEDLKMSLEVSNIGAPTLNPLDSETNNMLNIFPIECKMETQETESISNHNMDQRYKKSIVQDSSNQDNKQLVEIKVEKLETDFIDNKDIGQCYKESEAQYNLNKVKEEPVEYSIDISETVLIGHNNPNVFYTDIDIPKKDSEGNGKQSVDFMDTDCTEITMSTENCLHNTLNQDSESQSHVNLSLENSTADVESQKYVECATLEEFLTLSNQHSSKGISQFITQLFKWQNDLDSKCTDINLKKFSHTWFALHLYYTGPRAYRFLQNILTLPPITVLQKCVKPVGSNFSGNSLNALRMKVNKMSDHEKICSICIDVIPLKKKLFYDITYDRIIGLEETNGVQKSTVANYAVVIMVRGIVLNWSQLVSYSLVASWKKSTGLVTWIMNVVRSLSDLGLIIRLCITKQNFANTVPEFEKMFTINFKRIYFLYDVPNMMKCFRVNMEKYKFIYDVEDIRENNILTNSYLTHTMTNLFDLLNSNTLLSSHTFSKAYCGEDFQNDFLFEMLKLLKHLRVLNVNTEEDVTASMTYITGFQITINSIMLLFKELKENSNIRYILTRRLNLDIIRKFKNKLLQISSKPTGRIFSKMFNKMFVFQVMKKPIHVNLKTAMRSRNLITEISNFNKGKLNLNDNTQDFTVVKSLAVGTMDYQNFKAPSENDNYFIACYIFSKCTECHECNLIRLYAKRWVNVQDIASKYVPGKTDSDLLNKLIDEFKCPPLDAIIEFVNLLDKRYCDFFKNNSIRNMANEFYNSIATISFRMPCPCFPLEYFKKLFIRYRIYSTVKVNNKSLGKTLKFFNTKSQCLCSV